MLTNYHTHSIFCDGIDTPEEMVLAAIAKGFDALGFSGHGFTLKDSSYCMKDLVGYKQTVLDLKKKYADKIQIYHGVEEDMCHPAFRTDYEYIIGSSHYICKDNAYYAVDSGLDYYKKCVALFGGDAKAMAKSYYEAFVSYILSRKPDIVGHFDLITKYDEMNDNVLLGDREYLDIAAKYMERALDSDCIFEVNTGAIARACRTKPYPCEELLHLMRKRNAKLILSSDCHDSRMLDCKFVETEQLLRDIGFTSVYVLYNGVFQPRML